MDSILNPETPFLVTGLGASGTRWLAAYLKGIKGWEVWHENGPSIDDLYPRQGVVSSLERHRVCRDHLLYLKVGVIVRSPIDIAQHCLNKGTITRVLRELDKDLRQLDRLLEWGAKKFLFDDLIKDPAMVCRWLGVIAPSSIPGRVGHQQRKKTLPAAQAVSIEADTSWFSDKWLDRF